MTRVTLDVNPSVELMVDDTNRIVSVTALYDDGSILIAGETLIGKTPEEGISFLLELAGETGYLVKGEATENTVTLSVSGDNSYAESVKKKVTAAAEEALSSLDVKGKIQMAEALKKEALRELAGKTSLYTAEELAAMSEADLYRVLAAGRIETALLLTEEMRAAYYAAKAHEISFAEREATAKVIEAMGGIYTLVHAGYSSALSLYSSAITAVEEMRYELLVSPNSDYQKSLLALREAKAELLAGKNYVAKLELGGEEYIAATATLKLSEENYERALAAFEALGRAATEAIDELLAAMRETEQALIALEEQFSDDIKAELTAKAVETEAAVNARREAFFTTFEQAHADDIEAMTAALTAQKQALMNEIAK